ncbi:MAG: hypothetical protein KA450_04865 [Bacteroidia bacterium]|nr:hypothetical protein [Bacteroidia bacterium]
MKSNYKYLGSYIEFLNSRALNHESILDLDSIRGISSISKNFIKTKANLVGVVADKYKVVESGFFAYNPNTARMGDRIPIALNQFDYPVLVSSIYPTFKINDINKLLPEYLMMWFHRPEFDRYARFMSHGSAREVFDIDEMNGIMLPIPSITKQKEIVKEYNIIVNYIALNQQLIQKLEETAQAIYKQWFVDEGNENKKVKLNEYIRTNPPLSIKKNAIATYVEMNDLTTTSMRISGSIKREFIGGSKFQNGDTLLARITPCLENGKTAFVDILDEGEIAAGSTEFIVMRAKGDVSPYWVYCLARDDNFRSYAIGSMVGSSGRERVHEKYLDDYVLPEINSDKMNEFNFKMRPIFKSINIKSNEIIGLTELKDLLLSKLATIEN